jgi:hypothetical protein
VEGALSEQVVFVQRTKEDAGVRALIMKAMSVVMALGEDIISAKLTEEDSVARALTRTAISVVKALKGLLYSARLTEEDSVARALMRTAISATPVPVELLSFVVVMEEIHVNILMAMAISVVKAHKDLPASALRTKEDVDVQTALNGLIVAVEKRSLMAIVQHVTIDCFQTLNDLGFEITRPRNMQCFVTSSSIFPLIIS